MPRRGFSLCRRCGGVQGDDGEIQHTRTCNAGSAGSVADCLYLYREFRSEAVRMLIPAASGMHAQERISSFIAALELGLRRRFAGAVEHLRVMTCKFPAPESGPGNRLPDALRHGAGGHRLPEADDERSGQRARHLPHGSGGPGPVRVQRRSVEGRLLPLRVRLAAQPRDGRHVPQHRNRRAGCDPRTGGGSSGGRGPALGEGEPSAGKRAGSAFHRGAPSHRHGRRGGPCAGGRRRRQAGLRAHHCRNNVVPGSSGEGWRIRGRRRPEPSGLRDSSRTRGAGPVAGRRLHGRVRVSPEPDGRRLGPGARPWCERATWCGR